MASYAEDRLTRLVKKYDSTLFVRRNYKDVFQILRKDTKVAVYDVDGHTLVAIEPSEYFVTALTHNWKADGNPVEWGTEPIMKKLADIDGWNAQSEVNRLEETYKKADEAKNKDFSNKTEDVVREWLPHFKKATSDIVVGSMDKKKEFKRKRENKFKE